jgi:benzoylformate decarboxylase
VLFIVLANGGYAIMDRLAERNGSPGPWPQIDGVDVGAIARGFGCDAVRIDSHSELLSRLDSELATLADRDTPLLLEVVVAPDEAFDL